MHNPAATAVSAIVGGHANASTGIRGTWVKGARSISHCGIPNTPPNSPTTRKKASAPHPIAAVHRGNHPMAATATPTHTQTAGSRISAAGRTRPAPPRVPPPDASAKTVPRPSAKTRAAVPSRATSKWLAAYRVRESAVARTSSVCPCVSSARQRNTVVTPYAAAMIAMKPNSVDR